MKNQKLPTTSKFTVVRQLCNYIPNHLVPKLARKTGVDEQARTYDEWSHIVTLCYAQVTHSIGLNDVCDALQLNSGPLSAIRGATPPTRNNLSHANKVRDPSWLRSCSGRCIYIWGTSRRGLSVAKPPSGLRVNSSEPFTWWTPPRFS